MVKSKASADRLAKWNVAATFNADGAKWKPEHLKDANIILVPDDIGWRHSHVVGGLLRPYVKRIRVLVLSDLQPGLQSNGDGINWIDNPHSETIL